MLVAIVKGVLVPVAIVHVMLAASSGVCGVVYGDASVGTLRGRPEQRFCSILLQRVEIPFQRGLFFFPGHRDCCPPFARLVDEPLVSSERLGQVPMPPAALAVTAEGASCAARAVPSEGMQTTRTARCVPADCFPDRVFRHRARAQHRGQGKSDQRAKSVTIE